MPGNQSRRGYDPLADHTDGFRCGGNQGADCQDCRQGIRHLCPGCHRHCLCCHDWLADCRQGTVIRTGPGDFCSGHLLPVRAWSCHTGRHHGRQWHGSEKRHPVQDIGSTGKCRPGTDRRSRQDGNDHFRAAPGHRYHSGRRLYGRNTAAVRQRSGTKIRASAGPCHCK